MELKLFYFVCLLHEWILDIRVYPRMLYNHFLLAVFGPRREEEIEKEDATESDSGRHQSTNHAPTYERTAFTLFVFIVLFFFKKKIP